MAFIYQEYRQNNPSSPRQNWVNMAQGPSSIPRYSIPLAIQIAASFRLLNIPPCEALQRNEGWNVGHDIRPPEKIGSHILFSLVVNLVQLGFI